MIMPSKTMKKIARGFWIFIVLIIALSLVGFLLIPLFGGGAGYF